MESLAHPVATNAANRIKADNLMTRLRETGSPRYCRSYSPLFTRLSTVKPAFLASLKETGFVSFGVLKLVMTLRTGFLHAGHFVSSAALNGRRKVKRPPHATH